MKKVLFILPLFFCLAFTALAGGGNLKTTELKGQVLDQQGEPLAGVKIHLASIDKDIYTDFDGNFVVENVPLTEQSIQLELISFEKQEILVDANSLKSELHLELKSR
ncbi:MAG: hypothetical protein CMP59_10830 [Flavobacteriales bacterium]|nr:hypothetical protein [Flavobacteriales bacterium]|tara:strand:- start:886 stop:1206 length:321 start_codon:yes stop_codon:yes gene_type:complete